MNVRVSPRSNTAARCGYCHDSLRDVRPSACPACGATYHDDCAVELSGRCGTRGCAREVVRAPRVVARAAARRGGRRGWLVGLLAALILVMLPVSAAVVSAVTRARASEARRAAEEAAVQAELGAKVNELAAIAQMGTPSGARLERGRALYKELRGRGVGVDRAFIEEQVRRGHGGLAVYSYTSYHTREIVDVVELLTSS